jgi:hypothetical protein
VEDTDIFPQGYDIEIGQSLVASVLEDTQQTVESERLV